jgi:hypothetical protein
MFRHARTGTHNPQGHTTRSFRVTAGYNRLVQQNERKDPTSTTKSIMASNMNMNPFYNGSGGSPAYNTLPRHEEEDEPDEWDVEDDAWEESNTLLEDDIDDLPLHPPRNGTMGNSTNHSKIGGSRNVNISTGYRNGTNHGFGMGSNSTKTTRSAIAPPRPFHNAAHSFSKEEHPPQQPPQQQGRQTMRLVGVFVGMLVLWALYSSTGGSWNTDDDDFGGWNAEEKEDTSVRLVVLGERHSGVPWVTKYLKDCYPNAHVGSTLQRVGYFFQDEPSVGTASPLYNHPSTILVHVVTNPYDWVQRMRLFPEYTPNHVVWEKEEDDPSSSSLTLLPWKQFLEKPWTMDPRPARDEPFHDKTGNICQMNFPWNRVVSCVEAPSDPNGKHSALELNPIYELNPEDGTPFSSILELRAAKFKNIHALKEWDFVEDLVTLNYDQLVELPKEEEKEVDYLLKLLGQIEVTTGWKHECPTFKKKDGKRLTPPPLAEARNADMTHDYFHYLDTKIDWKVESLAQFGKWTDELQQTILNQYQPVVPAPVTTPMTQLPTIGVVPATGNKVTSVEGKPSDSKEEEAKADEARVSKDKEKKGTDDDETKEKKEKTVADDDDEEEEGVVSDDGFQNDDNEASAAENADDDDGYEEDGIVGEGASADDDSLEEDDDEGEKNVEDDDGNDEEEGGFADDDDFGVEEEGNAEVDDDSLEKEQEEYFTDDDGIEEEKGVVAKDDGLGDEKEGGAEESGSEEEESDDDEDDDDDDEVESAEKNASGDDEGQKSSEVEEKLRPGSKDTPSEEDSDDNEGDPKHGGDDKSESTDSGSDTATKDKGETKNDTQATPSESDSVNDKGDVKQGGTDKRQKEMEAKEGGKTKHVQSQNSTATGDDAEGESEKHQSGNHSKAHHEDPSTKKNAAKGQSADVVKDEKDAEPVDAEEKVQSSKEKESGGNDPSHKTHGSTTEGETKTVVSGNTESHSPGDHAAGGDADKQKNGTKTNGHDAPSDIEADVEALEEDDTTKKEKDDEARSGRNSTKEKGVRDRTGEVTSQNEAKGTHTGKNVTSDEHTSGADDNDIGKKNISGAGDTLKEASGGAKEVEQTNDSDLSEKPKETVAEAKIADEADQEETKNGENNGRV